MAPSNLQQVRRLTATHLHLLEFDHHLSSVHQIKILTNSLGHPAMKTVVSWCERLAQLVSQRYSLSTFYWGT